jgi:hypothetical protein
LSTALTELQDVVGKEFVKRYVRVECGTLRLVLDQEGVRADAAIVVHLLTQAHLRAGTAATRTGALRDVSPWPQEAFREGHAH